MQRRLPRRGDGLLVREVTPREPESLFTNSTSRSPTSGPETSDPLRDSDDDVRRLWNNHFTPYLGSIRRRRGRGRCSFTIATTHTDLYLCVCGTKPCGSRSERSSALGSAVLHVTPPRRSHWKSCHPKEKI